MIHSRMKVLVLYLLGFAGMRPEDVILASFPRSGNTWLRFLLCNLIGLLERDGKAVDFPLLNRTMPELGASNLLRSWPHSSIPRVVKTHKRRLPIFGRNQSIGIIRDPRDVMASYYHFLKDRRRRYDGNFGEFIRNPTFGLDCWFAHYTSWHRHWTLVIKYEDMQEDTLSEFNRVLDVLGVSYPEDVLREAIRRSSIESVRKVEGYSVSRDKGGTFARDGGTQQWRSYFTPQDLSYYDELGERYQVYVYASGKD